MDKKQKSRGKGRRNSDCMRLLHGIAGSGLQSTTTAPIIKETQTECNVSFQHKDSLTGVLRRSMSRFAFSKSRRELIDLHGEERASWEAEQMMSLLDLQAVHVDAAPFQLVENTSVFKIHSVFSLLGLRRAYVTKLGRLVGVVALKELRAAIEDINHSSTHGPLKTSEDVMVKHVDTFDSCINNV
ncbi:unnamed protein product [Heligmosomoides polygyrus]|uniref:CBS domain-containing protein n=1 Tax=Heligmosomoides polygyrus TaxID=6339 RepID=A0A3P7UAL0_HELPZ|nr:unnamed protein product [Heligmosomoides polygyrus]